MTRVKGLGWLVPTLAAIILTLLCETGVVRDESAMAYPWIGPVLILVVTLMAMQVLKDISAEEKRKEEEKAAKSISTQR